MPLYKLAQRARDRSKRIREVRESVLNKIIRRESDATIRNVLKFGKDGAA
jgi:hypothetical protein